MSRKGVIDLQDLLGVSFWAIHEPMARLVLPRRKSRLSTDVVDTYIAWPISSNGEGLVCERRHCTVSRVDNCSCCGGPLTLLLAQFGPPQSLSSSLYAFLIFAISGSADDFCRWALETRAPKWRRNQAMLLGCAPGRCTAKPCRGLKSAKIAYQIEVGGTN